MAGHHQLRQAVHRAPQRGAQRLGVGGAQHAVGQRGGHAALQQLLVGGDQRRGFFVGRARRAELGVEHQREGVRLLGGEAHVGQAQRHQPFQRAGRAFHGSLLRLQEAPHGFGAHGLEQAVAVREVVVGRRVAHAGGARHLAQAELRRRPLGQQAEGTVQQGLAQVAVVVGPGGFDRFDG